ncbi:hypothetical protein CAPTEDRAFT_188798 [Capitella teleta]|nr:hypothetical protein CAPTEDRAFT_188798 [Capitella teleta]|eukprot:ELT93625.1 hypothetical protein CAPTEDRAFT_188798 [Capitella teleta]
MGRLKYTMGCNFSKKPGFRVRVKRKQEDASARRIPQRKHRELLKTEQVALLKSSWQQLCVKRSPYFLGRQIFLRVFELNPEIKKSFQFGEFHGNDLINNPMFKIHVKNFVSVIDSSIRSVDSLKTVLAPTLHTLGGTHQSVEGFNKNNLEIFLKAMLLVLRQEFKSALDVDDLEVEVAWRKLLEFIVYQIHIGYRSAISTTPNKQKGFAQESP